MCESDRLALELELERCNAFLQWVACDEERQVDELNELVSREDALLDEGQRLQEVFNTADRLSDVQASWWKSSTREYGTSCCMSKP